MATNTHFNHKVKSEQNLYEDIIIESLQMFGQDVMYLPRHVITKDDILNEDYAKFENAYSIEMYIENTEGWGGEGDLMSKFGLQIRDQATFIVSKSRWEKILFSENQIRPFEGDLIYMPLSNAMLVRITCPAENPVVPTVIQLLPSYFMTEHLLLGVFSE